MWKEKDVYELQNIKVTLKFSIVFTLNKLKLKINVLAWVIIRVIIVTIVTIITIVISGSRTSLHSQSVKPFVVILSLKRESR